MEISRYLMFHGCQHRFSQWLKKCEAGENESSRPFARGGPKFRLVEVGGRFDLDLLQLLGTGDVFVCRVELACSTSILMSIGDGLICDDMDMSALTRSSSMFPANEMRQPIARYTGE